MDDFAVMVSCGGQCRVPGKEMWGGRSWGRDYSGVSGGEQDAPKDWVDLQSPLSDAGL